MKDFDSGGVGLPVARATEISQKLSDIVLHARDIQRYRRSRSTSITQIRGLELINRLAEFIATQFDLKLDAAQKSNFEESIAQRIGGFTKRDEFAMQMTLKTSDGGVGLSQKQGFDVVRLTEKLIALGIPRAGEAHH